jgi:2-polyprenyl-3-methyl-5-hydroxy-6-metoxy-1,4-benzoquinol methylase
MNGDAYYNYQIAARGLSTSADVEALTDEMSLVYRRLLPRWLPADRNASICEVACGAGIMLRYLRREGYANLTGSDRSDCQVALARAAGLPVVQADSLAELKRRPSDTWDCLIAIDFIEHLPKDVLIEFLAECGRTLKPGGCLILRAPNADSPFVGRNLFNDVTHVWAYTSVATRALLGMAGFQRVEFVDESVAGVRRHRWLKVPLMRLCQALLRRLIRVATREDVRWLHPSIYLCAWK